MKKIFGILIISCICMLLGLSIRWSKERNVSLAVAARNIEELGIML